MSNYKFLIESPSTVDHYDSKSHERTARAVLETLETDNDINLVGLEGGLGSGKSTVIELIKLSSSAREYRFIEFDVERFQHGATKKALIETIYAAIKEGVEKKEGQEKIEKAKNVALGNYFEYESNVKSNISIWVVWFGLSLVLASQVFIEALSGTAHFIAFLQQLMLSQDAILYEVDYFALASLFFVLLPWHIIRCAQKRKPILFLFGVPPSTGDIFKRNSKDTISETIEINKEVGAYELQEALQVFVAELPESSRYVLVIDNLDRVTEEKLREVWSDIEVFTSIADNKIQLILPYSRIHIAASLLGKEDEGREFISKRIPITFRVSPLISADWKRQCAAMIEFSLDNASKEDSMIIIRLISLWSDYDERQITPRYLKELVNSVVSIMIANTEEVNLVSAFFYQLTVQFHKIPIVKVLNKHERDSDETGENSDHKFLMKSWMTIEKKLEFESWSKDVVSIHYQTKYLIAESEILRNPLQIALENVNGARFIEKKNIYGYSRIVNEMLFEGGTEHFVNLVVDIANLDVHESKEWIDSWVPVISQYVESDSHSIADFDTWLKSRENIFDLSINISDADVQREFDKRDNEDSLQERGDLLKLHGLGALIGKRPKILEKFFPERFVNSLWVNRLDLKDWGIEDIALNERQVQDICAVAISEEKMSPSLVDRISRIYMLGWNKGKNPLGTLVPTVATKEDINEYPNVVARNIYAVDWYSSELSSYYQSLISVEKPGPLKTRLQAQAIANITYHRSYQHLPLFKPDIEASEEFVACLADCLAVSCAFSKLLQALKEPDLHPLVNDSIRKLIQEKRIFELSISAVVSDFESLQLTGLGSTELVSWLQRWGGEQIDLNALLNLNNSFVRAVFADKEQKNKYRDSYLALIATDDADDDWWASQIETPNENIKSIFESWFDSGGIEFSSSKALTSAMKKYFSVQNQLSVEKFDNRNWIQIICKSLGKNSLDPLIRILENELNKMNGSIELQASIIRNFGSFVSLGSMLNIDDQKHVLTLFENTLSDQLGADWFDSQAYSFSHWNDELLLQFERKMQEYLSSGFTFNRLGNHPIFNQHQK